MQKVQVKSGEKAGYWACENCGSIVESGMRCFECGWKEGEECRKSVMRDMAMMSQLDALSPFVLYNGSWEQWRIFI
jgi:hypothetical protein